MTIEAYNNWISIFTQQKDYSIDLGGADQVYFEIFNTKTHRIILSQYFTFKIHLVWNYHTILPHENFTFCSNTPKKIKRSILGDALEVNSDGSNQTLKLLSFPEGNYIKEIKKSILVYATYHGKDIEFSKYLINISNFNKDIECNVKFYNNTDYGVIYYEFNLSDTSIGTNTFNISIIDRNQSKTVYYECYFNILTIKFAPYLTFYTQDRIIIKKNDENGIFLRGIINDNNIFGNLTLYCTINETETREIFRKINSNIYQESFNESLNINSLDVGFYMAKLYAVDHSGNISKACGQF